MKNKNSLEAPEELIQRRKDEEIHPYRTEFERDRDRILYSRAFRRLAGKTQIFLPLSHDHVRNRLTHSLEVNQIAQVTAKNLGLDKELTEAISLGHDLGHTPFGHIGERTLNLSLNNCIRLHKYFRKMQDDQKGFKHNLHSLRVAAYLEKTYRNFSGMNLTNFALWGIKNHSSLSWTKYDESGQIKPCNYFNKGKCYFPLEPTNCNNKGYLSVDFYSQYDQLTKIQPHGIDAWSFEGLVVSFADEIAQRHHDIEDGLFMKIISPQELKRNIKKFFGKQFDPEDTENFEKLSKEKKEGYFLPLISRFVVNFLNKALIRHSEEKLKEFMYHHAIKNNKDFADVYPDIKYEDAEKCIDFPEELIQPHEKFKEFLKNRLLNSFEAQRMDGVGTYVIRQILKAYLTNPKQLPNLTLIAIENVHRGPGKKSMQDYTESDIGKLREKIDALSKKSSPAFQHSLLRGLCDHIAGMTDKYAISEYQRLYGVDFNINKFG